MKRPNLMLYLCRAALVALLSLSGVLPAAALEPIPAVTKEMRCPVCGMHPAAYPKWMAQIVFKDKTNAAFDSPADLFRYLQNMPRYGKGRAAADIGAIYVTHYGKGGWINAHDAWYVAGSNARGPMNMPDLAPFAARQEAEAFAKANGGKVLDFAQVTPSVLKGLSDE